jgi:DNA-binding response OmpR family regulator
MPTILVIEDNLMVRDNLVEILQLADYDVIEASDGKQGIMMAEARQPDLIICDLSLPILDGYVVLQILSKNETCCRIPFILLTARAERSDVRMGMNLGADDYITKPFNPSDLLNSIECQLKKVESYRHPRLNGMKKMESEIDVYDSNKEDPLKELVKDRNIKHFRNKQIIYQEGNFPSCLYYIVKGKIKSFVVDEDGKDLITELCSEGDFLGYAALLERTRYMDTAEAIGEVELAMIPIEDFEEVLLKDAAMRQQIFKLLTQNIDQKEIQLLKIAYDSLRKKTADALLTVYRKYNITDYRNVGLKFSRGNLAALAGVPKESLARTLAAFRDEHLIDVRSGIIYIREMDRISQLSK